MKKIHSMVYAQGMRRQPAQIRTLDKKRVEKKDRTSSEDLSGTGGSLYQNKSRTGDMTPGNDNAKKTEAENWEP